jgi:hypothetical protein
MVERTHSPLCTMHNKMDEIEFQWKTYFPHSCRTSTFAVELRRRPGHRRTGADSSTRVASSSAVAPHPQAHRAAAEPLHSWCNMARPEPSSGRLLPPALRRGSRGTTRGPWPRRTLGKVEHGSRHLTACLLALLAYVCVAKLLTVLRVSCKSVRDHSSIQPTNAVVEPSLLLLELHRHLVPRASLLPPLPTPTKGFGRSPFLDHGGSQT